MFAADRSYQVHEIRRTERFSPKLTTFRIKLSRQTESVQISCTRRRRRAYQLILPRRRRPRRAQHDTACETQRLNGFCRAALRGKRARQFEARRPASADRTARRQFQATGHPVSRTQASEAMTCRAMRRSVCNAGASNAGRSLCVQISREQSYPLAI